MANKRVIAEVAPGELYGFASVAKAREKYPDCTIVRYEDGTPYVEPKAKGVPTKADPKKDEKDDA